MAYKELTYSQESEYQKAPYSRVDEKQNVDEDFEQYPRSHLFQKDKVLYYYSKRLLDIIAASSVILVLLPLIVLIAILVKLDSSGPIFFVQERVGAKRKSKGGKTRWKIQNFSMYKFRSMRVDSNDNLHREFMEAYISGDEDKMTDLQPDPDAANAFKIAKDPRVTRIGHFLRKSSLDELPQLWNVIEGNMSLVGPRPPIPYEVEMYDAEQFQRLAATPGITGLWQISGRNEIDFAQLVELDVEYIKKQSLWLDLKILLGTIPAVLARQGAE